MSSGDSKSTIEKIAALGVKDPRNPNAQEIRTILGAYLVDRKISQQLFSDYLRSFSAPLQVFLNGLKQFSQDSQRTSERVMDIIKHAMSILEKELERDLSKEERERIQQKVFELIAESRSEAKRERKFRREMMYFGGGVVLLVGGGVTYLATKGKVKEPLKKGAELLRSIGK
jgi:hypothetical protein